MRKGLRLSFSTKIHDVFAREQSILDRDSNVTRGENTYLRHKVMAEAEDEAVLAVPEKDGMVSKRVPLAIKLHPNRCRCEKPRSFKGFGNFLFSKVFGNSIDEIAVDRGSNRI